MLTPTEITATTIKTGKVKASLPWWKMILLGIFAGMFIALAGVGATFGNLYGGKIAGACIFTAGLAMVIVAGSELFTGNNLMVMALFDRKIKLHQLLKNWLLVFFGNFLGALLVASIATVSGTFDSVADTVVATATAKVNLGFFEALLKGIMCNFLVCIAVWMATAASTVTGKIMFYIPTGIITGTIYSIPAPTITEFLLNNLLPVTLGNIIGGAVLVASGYYLAYRPKSTK